MRFPHRLLVIFFVLSISLFAQKNKNPLSDFEVVLNSLDQSIEKFVNGDTESFRNFWLHDDDITIAGGFGGKIEKGWDSIGKRLSRVSESYNTTDFTTERIMFDADDEIGFVVQHEYFKVYDDSGELVNTRAYRVTMLFQLIKNEWKLIHRHADPSMEWEGMK